MIEIKQLSLSCYNKFLEKTIYGKITNIIKILFKGGDYWQENFPQKSNGNVKSFVYYNKRISNNQFSFWNKKDCQRSVLYMSS